MRGTRQPAVAGAFYPRAPEDLRAALRELLGDVASSAQVARPKALIVPHAGWIYSGSVAARAYVLLRPLQSEIRRVVLLGPSHFVPFRGHAVASTDAFTTPLGEIRLDAAGRADLHQHGLVVIADEPHRREHSLEVQLPFLQELLDDFELLPIAVGESSAEETAEILDRSWDGPETLILISSDLSHYHDYATAQAIDETTAEAIDQLSRTDLRADEACGCHPINGMIEAARRRGMRCSRLDLRNSGDTAGPRDQVVGYGAWALEEIGEP
jgi:MEMO1 family protein